MKTQSHFISTSNFETKKNFHLAKITECFNRAGLAVFENHATKNQSRDFMTRRRRDT